MSDDLTSRMDNRTSRDVVAQALDYASWVEELESDDIAAIYARFRPGRNLTLVLPPGLIAGVVRLEDI
jgi:hypothetical protein